MLTQEPCSGDISHMPEKHFICHIKLPSFGICPDPLLPHFCILEHSETSPHHRDVPQPFGEELGKQAKILGLMFGDCPTLLRLKHAKGFPGSLPVPRPHRCLYLELMESPAASAPAKLLQSQPGGCTGSNLGAVHRPKNSNPAPFLPLLLQDSSLISAFQFSISQLPLAPHIGGTIAVTSPVSPWRKRGVAVAPPS